MSPRPAVQDIREHLRRRILDAFERRAAQDGPRAVVMAELARDLGISTRTLYQVFESKAELVRAVMQTWADQLEEEQRQRLASDRPVRDRILEGAFTWIDGQDRFSSVFWSQVRRDFPEATRIVDLQIVQTMARARAIAIDALREDVRPELALPLLLNAIREAGRPSFCNRLGLSRKESVTEAVDLWCRGALVPREAERAAPLATRPNPS